MSDTSNPPAWRKELDVMTMCVHALATLDLSSRLRALGWICQASGADRRIGDALYEASEREAAKVAREVAGRGMAL